MKRSMWRRYAGPVPALSLGEASASGYWRCLDCDAINSREESDQGEPAQCGRCGSHKLRYQPAVFQSSLP